jgi:hypothetical protein
MSDQDSFNAGNSNQPLPPGGDMNAWQSGRGVRAWNDAERARQEAVWSPQPNADTWKPVAPVIPQINWVVGRGVRNNPFLAIGGLLALIFIAAPLYQYSIPLWVALYPAAAVATLAVYAGVYMGLKEFIFAAVAAFVAAWPLTLVEHGMSNDRGYWTVRHLARLVLVFVWAIYALSLRELNVRHMPDLTHGGWPRMIVTPSHLGLAAALVVVMHLWLWRFRTWK